VNAVLDTASHSAGVLDTRGRPLRDLRLSVTDACNFRCPYCMPADQVGDMPILDSASRLSFDEIDTLVRGFVANGVRKLRITGGEPLLRRGLPGLIERLARIDGLDDIALTTNGSLLARHAGALRDAGLHRITVSLDALDPTIFSALSGGRGDVVDVLDGIDAAVAAGFESIKLNCVVQRGINESEVLPLAARFRHTPHVLRFIEYMDVGTCNGWDPTRVVASHELHARIDSTWPLRALQPCADGEVAVRHGYVDGAGEVGFVSSVSAPFCSDCNRARVAADGTLYTCLFAGQGTPLRAAVGDGADAAAAHIGSIWRARDDRYSELRLQTDAPRRHVEMFLVGG